RRNIQLVFQDPYASLNPRMTVGQIIGEGLIIYNIAKGEVNRKKVLEILDVVGLTKDSISRYPHEFSGGQRQRIGIARALSLSPKLIIADEPISALDVSIQAQILNLLNKLQKQFGFTYLFIAHDLRIVEYISDRVIVMYLGKIMEIADSKALYKIPYHPYTEALISSIPAINSEKKEKRIILKDDIPSPINLPSGCQFHTRCRYSTIKCQREEPELIQKNGRYFSCHFPLFD
ncbi:MAG: ATP-binding cassette domain-containing protein, partial [Candidatus Omnitrophica bacterium]|nr:ATP-binding cassette domain-containing protein [Candidatus Omnitrophota bacterium]